MAKEKRTYDDYLAELQGTANGRFVIANRLGELLERSYAWRDSDARNLSQEEFSQLRYQQLAKIYNVYGEMSSGFGYHGTLRPNSVYDNSIEAARRVTGPNGACRNNGAIAINSDEMEVASAVARLTSKFADRGPSYRLPASQAMNVINTILSIKSILNDMGVNISAERLCEETDVLKRELYKAEVIYQHEMFESYTQYRPKSKLSKMVTAIKDFINGTKEQDKKFGDKTMEY